MGQNQPQPDITDILHHMGEHDLPIHAVAPPIFQNSIFCFDSFEDFHEALEHESEHFIYSRGNNPTVNLCEEKIAARGLDMKLVDVEYTFDNSKVIFYFTSDGRVDFRELVKDLASAFRMRIELRQIGVRDETKMMGGIGPCGRELCCHCFLDDFETVSIKMAKTQNLSLNPTKISGMCGRLMCCLQYENDTYLELRKGMPQPGDYIDTPDGKAVVDDVSILQNRIRSRLVLEESSADKPEKLSSEYYIYKKEEISKDIKKKQAKRPESARSRNKEEDAPLTDLAALED